MGKSGDVAIGVEWGFVVLSLSFIVARLYIRIVYHHQKPNASDNLAVIGWLFALGAVSCDTKTYQINGLVYTGFGPTNKDLVPLHKIAYADDIVNDVGFYLPKLSLLALYYDIISPIFTKLRLSLHIITACVISACFITWGLDTFWCKPISDNWSMDPKTCQLFAQETITSVNWGLSISSDLAIFILPFFLFRHLSLSRKQSIGLMATFFLGAITMLCSTARFVVLRVLILSNFAPIYILYCMELNISLVVVSIPLLKPLLRSKEGENNRGSESEKESSAAIY